MYTLHTRPIIYLAVYPLPRSVEIQPLVVSQPQPLLRFIRSETQNIPHDVDLELVEIPIYTREEQGFELVRAIFNFVACEELGGLRGGDIVGGRGFATGFGRWWRCFEA
jgi:hypothetical protein